MKSTPLLDDRGDWIRTSLAFTPDDIRLLQSIPDLIREHLGADALEGKATSRTAFMRAALRWFARCIADGTLTAGDL